MKKTGFYWQPKDAKGNVWHLRNASHMRVGIVVKTLDDKEAMGCTARYPNYRRFQNMFLAATWVARDCGAAV